MPKKPYETTKANFEYFKTRCKYWLDYFGLKNWCVEFYHSNVDGARGQCNWSISGRIATIDLSTQWERHRKEPPCEKDLDRVAFHEVCELLTSRIRMMAYGKITSNDEVVDEEIHNIIRTLENTVFEQNIAGAINGKAT